MTRELNRIGQRLYRELFPPELRREYREFCGKVHTLQIVSDEPWIPWELIKPYDDDGELIDHDFLCLQYELARWVSPAAKVPAAEITVEALACIAPTDSGLPLAQQERQDLLDRAGQRGVQTHAPAPADRRAVEKLLEGDLAIQLWHFACHGDFDQQSPGRSPLYLQDREEFRPDQIVGRAQTHLKRQQPLVFLNACRVGTGGFHLTGLGGWAAVLVGDCGVGAFLAPMWSVDDRLACQFADKFYDVVCSEPGCTIAHAVREARRSVRSSAPHNPTWLAYSLYAHPNAHVRLGTVASNGH